jgi:hypothetical protein
MIGKIVGNSISKAISRNSRAPDPVAGAIIGAATLAVARKVLPRSVAGVGATIAAAYIAKKLSDRMERAQNGAATDAAAPASLLPSPRKRLPRPRILRKG